MQPLHVVFFAAMAIDLACAGSVRAEESVYLRCKADPSYVGEPNIVIDKAKRTITIVPVKEGLPLREDETYYEGLTEFNGQVMLRIAVNKFTLRFTIQSAMEPRYAVGQCVIEQKKL
jgi:hypothetical protein